MSEITEKISGTCGDNLSWEVTDEGTLVVSGEGKMTGYILANPFDPTGEEEGIINYRWDRQKAGIFAIDLKDGITTIGEFAFSGIPGLKKVTIPETVKSIGLGAFVACGKLEHVYYGGTPAMWDEIQIADGNDQLCRAEIHFARGAKPTTCPNCGKHVQQDFLLCPYCGTKLG